MFRKIIAGTAIAGALTFGAAGIAGASTPTTPTRVEHGRLVRQAPGPSGQGPGP